MATAPDVGRAASAACSTSSLATSPQPTVTWMFMNLCGAARAQVMSGLLITQFESRTSDKLWLLSTWTPAKWTYTNCRG